METEQEELVRRFKIICRKCESNDTVVSIEEGINYGGMTGYSPGHITIGCNECGKNDFYMSI